MTQQLNTNNISDEEMFEQVLINLESVKIISEESLMHFSYLFFGMGMILILIAIICLILDFNAERKFDHHTITSFILGFPSVVFGGLYIIFKKFIDIDSFKIENILNFFNIIGILILIIILFINLYKSIMDIIYVYKFNKMLNQKKNMPHKKPLNMFGIVREIKKFHTNETYENIARYIREHSYNEKLVLSNVKRIDILYQIANNIISIDNQDIYSNIIKDSIEIHLKNIKHIKGIKLLQEYAEIELIYEELNNL